MSCGGADIAKVVSAIEGDGGTERVRHVAVSCTGGRSTIKPQQMTLTWHTKAAHHRRKARYVMTSGGPGIRCRC